MNVYVLVEGRRTEKKIYTSWIESIFPALQKVEKIDSLKTNNYFIVSGNGYPSYLGRIHSALEDISQHGSIDYLWICIDTEDLSVEEKKQEINEIIAQGKSFPGVHIITQNCCIETWLLGHSSFLKRNPQSPDLREYSKFYNVSQDDPEKMHYPTSWQGKKAQFHFEYLREMFRERNLTYSKINPNDATQKHYFSAIYKRYCSTGHLGSFGELIEVWKNLGGDFDF